MLLSLDGSPSSLHFHICATRSQAIGPRVLSSHVSLPTTRCAVAAVLSVLHSLRSPGSRLPSLRATLSVIPSLTVVRPLTVVLQCPNPTPPFLLRAVPSSMCPLCPCLSRHTRSAHSSCSAPFSVLLPYLPCPFAPLLPPSPSFFFQAFRQHVESIDNILKSMLVATMFWSV
jgi:hypothetical protein